jgi:hypothetical protein
MGSGLIWSIGLVFSRNVLVDAEEAFEKWVELLRKHFLNSESLEVGDEHKCLSSSQPQLVCLWGLKDIHEQFAQVPSRYPA